MEVRGLENKVFVVTISWEINAEELVGNNLQEDILNHLEYIGGYAEITNTVMLDKQVPIQRHLPAISKPINAWGKESRGGLANVVKDSN